MAAMTKRKREEVVDQITSQRLKVDFDTFDITVKQLIQMVEDNYIDIAPAYQRQFRWEAARQSTFIESVLLGIPIPSLFMAANRDGTWELVDGVQRLSTLVHFAGNKDVRTSLGLGIPLVLEGLDKLDAINGQKYSELPKSVQMQFELKPIKVVTISDKSDLQVRFDLFERLNTGGVALTPQEIRACIYRGGFSDYLEKLSKNSDFRTVVRLPKPKESDGTREEFVLRFFAFLYGYETFDHSVVQFLNAFMKKATKSYDAAQMTKVFERTFRELAKRFPKGIKRTRTTTPVNLFEGVAVGAALALEQNGELAGGKSHQWMDDEDLVKSTTAATNSRKQVKHRIEFCRDHFLGKE
jgi:hypothetical protein